MSDPRDSAVSANPSPPQSEPTKHVTPDAPRTLSEKPYLATQPIQGTSFIEVTPQPQTLSFEQKLIVGRLAHLLLGTEDGAPIEWDRLVPALQTLVGHSQPAASPPTPDSAPPEDLVPERTNEELLAAAGSPLQSGAGSVGEEPTEIWVDDSKPAPSGCAVARTFDYALQLMRRFDYSKLYLDHDLGEDGPNRTGYDLLLTLMEENRCPPVVECISWNPVGRKRIADALASRSPSPLVSVEEPSGWLNPKRLARDAVQRLADSEPTDDSIEGMERLRGTPQESMFVVSGDELERVIETTIEDAIFDASRPLVSPDSPDITK